MAVGALAACSGNHQIAGKQPPATDRPAETVLRSDQTQVSGRLTGAHIIGVTAPLRFPLTITAATRGSGGVRIVGVSVGGRPGTVSWDAGQPLPLSGTGTLDLQQVALDADGSGLVWHLDGTPRLLSAGHYATGSSVAIGAGGLGEAVDRASFDVAPGATGALTSRGDARIVQPATAVTITGPGTVTLQGTLTAATAAGTRPARTVSLPSGLFQLSLTPAPGGLTVTALLQGGVTTT